jgi:predicted DNA-binding WGR domain protein
MRFPLLAACQVRWQLTPDEQQLAPATPAVEQTDGYVAITVHDEKGDGPNDSQRAAFRFLMKNQDQVAARILSGLLRGTKHFSSFAGGPHEPHVTRLGLLTVDGIRELVALCDIHFLEEAKANESYVTAEFGCCWDEEHGISVLVHHGEFVASSVGDDFCGRGTADNLEAHARYCREHLERGAASDTASSPALGVSRYFEFVSGSSRKFWEISWSGSDVTTRWGRIGTAGQSKTKKSKDAAAAKKEYDKLIAEKTNKGYTEK